MRESSPISTAALRVTSQVVIFKRRGSEPRWRSARSVANTVRNSWNAVNHGVPVSVGQAADQPTGGWANLLRSLREGKFYSGIASHTTKVDSGAGASRRKLITNGSGHNISNSSRTR